MTEMSLSRLVEAILVLRMMGWFLRFATCGSCGICPGRIRDVAFGLIGGCGKAMPVNAVGVLTVVAPL